MAHIFITASFPLEENASGCTCFLDEHGSVHHQSAANAERVLVPGILLCQRLTENDNILLL